MLTHITHVALDPAHVAFDPAHDAFDVGAAADFNLFGVIDVGRSSRLYISIVNLRVAWSLPPGAVVLNVVPGASCYVFKTWIFV